MKIEAHSSMIAILLCFLLLPGLSWGFDRIGHETIGHIAENRLRSSTLERIREIIGAGQTLASISTWADEIRQYRPETRPWHYINLPVREEINESHVPRYCPNNDCVIAQIQISAGVLTDASRIKREKDQALKFLVHFIGDIHQPLHCADDGDRGGNEKQIRFQRKQMNLHAQSVETFFSSLVGTTNSLTLRSVNADQPNSLAILKLNRVAVDNALDSSVGVGG